MPTLPLPTFKDGRAPEVSSGFGPRPVRQRDGSTKQVMHRGADMSYRAIPSDPPPKRVGKRIVYTATRTAKFYSPRGMPVLATESGLVVQAKKKKGIGGDVWLHHEDTGRVTRYAHLSSLAVRVGDRVREGQMLGLWGAGPGTPFIHLHFELLTAGKKNSQEDPASYLASASPGPQVRPKVAASSKGGAAGGGFPWLLLAIGVLVSTRS